MAPRLVRRPSGAGVQITLEGTVTAQDVRSGLLLVVRDHAWELPVLWDFRAVTDVELSHRDLANTVSFIERYMGHLPDRGRIAILATAPRARAAAMTYRELLLPKDRGGVRVVDTLDAADAWLDGRSANATTPRAMRFEMHDAIGSLDTVAGAIVNVSRTGALIVMPHAEEPGRERRLSLELSNRKIDLGVRVVRSQPDQSNRNATYWRVAVEFLSPSDAIEQVQLLLAER